MANTSIEQVFDLHEDSLWDLIGEFGNMSKWTGLPASTCVQQGSGAGALRTLTLADGSTIIDRLEAQTERSYSYSIVNIDDAPLPYSSYRATMKVERVSDTSSKLIWSGDFDPDGISDDEAVAVARRMYTMGIDMMKAAAAKL